jgi:hypothetical protein
MILNSTTCKALLNISTSTTTYDSLIDEYIPFVQADILEIANHRFHDAYHWVWNDMFVFSSSSKTITLGTNSTVDFAKEFRIGDTVDVQASYNNNGLYTVSTRSSNVLTVNENLFDENSTDFLIKTVIYRCYFDNSIQRIASKMVWWNIQNTTSVQGDILSESLGSYSVSYARNSNAKSFGLYPNNLIAGIKKKAGSL